MADYIAAHITLSGPIPVSLVPQLCQAITQQRVALEFGDCQFHPQSAGKLLEAVTLVDGVPVLRLYDDDAVWGELPQLEGFLQQEGIAFDRFHEGKFDIDPGLRQFRPATGCQDFPATSTGEVLLAIQDVVGTRAQLATAQQQLAQGELELAAGSLQALLTALSERLVEPAPLLALEIT